MNQCLTIQLQKTNHMQGCKEKNLKKYSKKNRNSCGAILLEMVDIFPAVAFHN